MPEKPDCLAIREMFTDDSLGEMPRENLGPYRGHLEACPACRALLGAYRKTVTLCRQLPREEVPDELHRRIMSGLARYRESGFFTLRLVIVEKPPGGARRRHLPRPNPVGTWAPPIDLFSEGRRLVLRVFLPGARRSEIAVASYPERVLVSGRTTAPAGPAYREIPRGPFFRLVELPRRVNPARTIANLDNGVLTVSLSPSASRAA